ncbi:MAG TPA: hypothetical protein VG267_04490 [Terracidiphilus sp.]|jgi:hypothetical protein|nr:hypothetical protein [Terracidiphilus sp.]
MPKQQYYGRQKFEITFTGDSLEARCHLPFGPKRNRILFSLLLILLAVWGSYRTWLLPGGAYGRSTWWYFAHHYSLLDPGALVFATGFYVLFLLTGTRLLCPAGAILTCNRSQVTTTRIPWYSFTGHWVTHAYDALDVSGFRLKYFGSGRGGSVYGIRFFVNGSAKTIFHGSIEPPEAYRILLRVKNLGLDVASDPKLLSRVKLGLLDRQEEELDRRMGI